MSERTRSGRNGFAEGVSERSKNDRGRSEGNPAQYDFGRISRGFSNRSAQCLNKERFSVGVAIPFTQNRIIRIARVLPLYA